MEIPKRTNPSSSKPPSWRILEFYSGIGGMRYSLMRALGEAAEVVEAFEINDVANDVYQFNFSHRPYQGNIQNLFPAELDKYGANAWLLSPPCQPYTRQGLQKDSADARASSFIKIIEDIPSMQNPPLAIFVENVVGFETSDTHRHLMETLDANDYVTQEFILSPVQFGIPYSRPRYFCLAKLKPLSFVDSTFNGLILRSPIPLGICISDGLTDQTSQANVRWDELDLYCSPIKNFLQFECSSPYGLEDATSNPSEKPTDYNEKQIKDVEDANLIDSCASERGGDSLTGSLREYTVPSNLIERWGSAMDIVFPNSRRCCCFTKSYHRYVKGTGSLLATVQPMKMSESTSLKDLRLRYFTPREVASLHSFPEDFDFPSHITLKQRYALLGNSLSIAVVAPLLQYLFDKPT